MAYDVTLAGRIRAAVVEQPGITEKKMFGGIAWMVNGNMTCGIIGDELMVRVGKDAHEAALAEPHTHDRPWHGDQRPMRGIVMVQPAGIESEAALRAWIDRALAFTAPLPPKVK